MPDISVIIPNFNRAGLIGETIENILSQTYRSLELIVVDDGSTDESVSVIKKFGDKVRLIEQPNRGPGAARNAGLEIATGEFIQFFDSDDLMTRNKLDVQASLLKNDPKVDLAYGPYVMAVREKNEWRQADVIMQYYPLPDKPLSRLVAEGWCAITQSCLFRREVVRRAGQWREDLMPHEDKEYWYRLGKVIRRSLHEKKSCVFYRQHSNQITDLQVKVLNRTIDGIKALDLILSQMRKDKSPFFSKLLCAGIRAGHVRYLNSHSRFDFRNDIQAKLAYSVYRIYQKIGRLKTDTDWQPFHGALKNSESEFEKYKLLI